jgi:hypothetical protein
VSIGRMDVVGTEAYFAMCWISASLDLVIRRVSCWWNSLRGLAASFVSCVSPHKKNAGFG